MQEVVAGARYGHKTHDMLSKDLVDAMNYAIEEEIVQAEQRAADSDSESTLQERVETLTKLRPLHPQRMRKHFGRRPAT